MIILDPDRDGCTVWLINSPITNNVNKVTRIKGETVDEICKSLIARLTEYKQIKNQWGNWVTELVWKDYVYLDIAAMGHVYKDVFNRQYNMPVLDIIPGNANNIIPARIYI